MAGRPRKTGLDFAGWAVDIFDNDPKIDRLMDAQGCPGFVVYFYLCQRAYGSDGYFYRWSYDDAATTARKIGGGVGSETVVQTVNLCLRIGLFDNGLFVGYGIITSRGIQKRYMQVALTRTNKSVITEYWLLEREESTGLDFHTLNSNISPGNSNFTPENANYQLPKESKVKNSKVEERKEDTSDANASSLDDAKRIIEYLNKRTGKSFKSSTKSTVSHIRSRLREGYAYEDFVKVIDRKVADWLGDAKMSEYLRPETLFGTKFEGYLNQHAKQPQSKNYDTGDDFLSGGG